MKETHFEHPHTSSDQSGGSGPSCFLEGERERLVLCAYAYLLEYSSLSHIETCLSLEAWPGKAQEGGNERGEAISGNNFQKEIYKGSARSEHNNQGRMKK
jgi:hypothetical protein